MALLSCQNTVKMGNVSCKMRKQNGECNVYSLIKMGKTQGGKTPNRLQPTFFSEKDGMSRKAT